MANPDCDVHSNQINQYPELNTLGVKFNHGEMDFYLSVDTQKLSGPNTTDQGLPFRRSSPGY